MRMASLEYQIGAAGLGLGAFSTTADLLSACSKMYDLWKSVQGLDAHMETLRAKLILQQALLEQWQREWLDFSVSERQAIHKRRFLKDHKATVETTLEALKKLLGDLEPLRVIAAPEKSLSAAQKLHWVTRQVSSSEKALGEIESLLSSLYRLFPISTPNTTVSQAVLALDSLPDSVSLSSLQTALGHTISLRRFRRGLDEDLEKRVAEFLQVLPTTRLELKPEQVTITSHDDISAGFRSFGLLDGTVKVVIEWKKYDASWQGQKGIRLRGRIHNIAQFLHCDFKPDELLTLKCLGVFDDTEHSRYGFVFSQPTNTDSNMVSLRQLLDQRTAETLPALEDRYSVCYNLSLSLAILHTAGWLHKSIRSHNVLFPVRGGRPVWTQPYLVGFDFSRLDAVDESSEKPEQSTRFNLYRHPSAQNGPGEGYRPVFDVYSFGVLMAEVGLWRSAWKLWSDGMTATGFRDNIISKSNDWLAHYAGQPFKEAVLKCLSGELEKTTYPIHRAFYIEVVEVLGRLVEDQIS